MCPPSSVVELHEYSTDETVIKSLMQIKSGVILPSNVLTDVDPYQFAPSNLPAGMWYFWSGSKTDTKNGFWRSTGEACEIYNTSLVIGLRKTLRFYEGPAHEGQKTNWMMQEYTTTEKYTSKMDPRALYRVFLVDDSSSGGGHLSKSEIHVKTCDGVAGPSDVANQSLDQLLGNFVSGNDFLELDDLASPLSHSTNSADSSCMARSMTSEEFFDSDALMRELHGKNNAEVAGPSDMANQLSDQLLGDYVSRDDFLELDDLAAPLSRSTSSADSSSMTSEESFDSDVLMRELGDDIVDQETQDSRVKLNLSAPAKSKQVVMQQTTLGSVDDVESSKLCTGQTSKINPTPDSNNNSNEVDTSPPPPPSLSPPPAPPSSSPSPAPSSSSPPPAAASLTPPPPSLPPPQPSSLNLSEGSSREEKKDHRANRTKKRKIMKYICFLAF